MRRRTFVAVLAPLALSGSAVQHEAPRHPQVRASNAAALAFPLPPRGHLSTRARLLEGPRVMSSEATHGRALTMYGNAGARSRLLIAGCASGDRCAGTDVVRAAMIGCPPPDAELWFFESLDPDGVDLDETPSHPGAAAWRQAVADLRPRTVIVFRTGPRPMVRAAGPSAGTGRRYARLAGLPFSETATHGLAAWTSTARPRTAAITVELPNGRVSARQASRLAYAIDRLAGTRFAAGAEWERRNLIAHGQDPRSFGTDLAQNRHIRVLSSVRSWP